MRLHFQLVQSHFVSFRAPFIQQGLACDPIGSLINKADLVFKTHAHFGAGHEILALLKTGVALGFNFILNWPVRQLISGQHGTHFSEFGLFFGNKLLIGNPVHTLGVDKYRPGYGVFLRQRAHHSGKTESQRFCLIVGLGQGR